MASRGSLVVSQGEPTTDARCIRERASVLRRCKLSRHDLALLLMTVIWGANYSIVKVALREIPPLAFNSLRLGIASLLFLLTLAVCRRYSGDSPVFARSRIARRDWLLIAAYGLVGHYVYQICFLLGLVRTTVANSSLILGCSPVVVALFSALVGHERVRPIHWVGTALSVAGIYLVVGRGAAVGSARLAGDALTFAALVCWGVYTVGAKGLLDRHSPLEVTGYSMAFGTVPFVLMGSAELRAMSWGAVSGQGWAALSFSAVFALFIAYLIWYAAVQRIGNVRTAMYSNVTPLAALVLGVVWLGEPVTTAEVVGAAAIISGMALTRLAPHAAGAAAMPAEE